MFSYEKDHLFAIYSCLYLTLLAWDGIPGGLEYPEKDVIRGSGFQGSVGKKNGAASYRLHTSEKLAGHYGLEYRSKSANASLPGWERDAGPGRFG